MIREAVGGGWYALRTFISTYAQRLGMSDVRYGATLGELARHLEAERRLDHRFTTLLTESPCDDEPDS
ncbi:hypothetical protein Misp01_05930 [Microtetraspora sp. NBRC 13810]|nr:hypothetical protein Misp01_05930 [Microtetraspora sp. NBRC 13810]